MRHEEDVNSPLMAGRGDSVPGVVLLTLPQTGAGRRLETLVSMFQQTRDRTQTQKLLLEWKTELWFVLFTMKTNNKMQPQPNASAKPQKPN